MCRLEKFHLPLRPNLKDWNMMTLNKKWMRLMVLVGCAALTASCKQAPVAQMEAEYAVLKVSPSDKVLSTTYSATIRGRQDIDIYPQVSGFLTRLCVEEGQAVRKGQVLFIIDQVPYKAALETACGGVPCQVGRMPVCSHYRRQETAAEKCQSVPMATIVGGS